MEFFYTTIALLTAGVSLSAGLISLFIGLNKDGDKAEVVFGIMCLCMVLFFLLPPVGFILLDKAPYTAQIKLKRIFNFSFSALLPWFIFYYSGLKKRLIPVAISILVITCYLVMYFTNVDSSKPSWALMVPPIDGIIAVYGFYAGIAQIRRSEIKKGNWLIIAISLIVVLDGLTLINQLGDNYFGRMLGTKLFFPTNLYPLPFILMMSASLRASVFEKYRLQKTLNWQNARWDSIAEGIQLFILELNNEGRIKYLNPYAAKVLGYNSMSEIVGKSWFDTFISKKEVETWRLYFKKIIEPGKVEQVINTIVNKYGEEITVNWTTVFVYDDKFNICGTMSIGLNMSDQQKALKQIQLLKTELQKEDINLKDKLAYNENNGGIIGKSEAILYAIQKAMQVAATNATVLLEGETGVGKELFANLIHKNSNRCNNAFIKINCAALPPDLIESELFGHDKGAFTGALQARKGRFELADGGTIFLDEIGEMPLSLQPKLLRVLENGEFERVGAQNTLKVDVRVISATNKDLLNEARAGRFREDLYYRLNVFPLTIPALRNRKDDIPSLVNYFVARFSAENKKAIVDISHADLARLTAFPWPGNVRELINLIERSVISSKGKTLKLDWLNNNTPNKETILPHFSMEEVERLHLLKVLTETNWKINGDDGAAAKLGLNPNTLRSRLKKLNISRSEA